MSGGTVNTRWFEQPDGGYEYGLSFPHVDILRDSVGKFRVGWEMRTSYAKIEDAFRAAEAEVRQWLTDAVEALGGHVTWDGGNVSNARH